MIGSRPSDDDKGGTPVAPTCPDLLKTEYRKLLELRERVKRAELFAKRARRSIAKVRHDPRGPDTDSTRRRTRSLLL